MGQALLIDWLPERASVEAQRVDDLTWFLFWVSAVVFVLVTAVLIYVVWAFRADPDDESDGPPMHGNTRLEVIWTIIPAILLAILSVYAIVVLDRNEQLDSDRVEVEIVGEQFAWKVVYPEIGAETGDLRIPVDRQVRLSMRASDVIHSFWVPAMRVKQDVVPGIETDLVFKPTEVGTYEVICAELCGAGHGVMRTRAIVMEQDAYDEWLRGADAKVKAEKNGPPPGNAPESAEGENATEAQEG